MDQKPRIDPGWNDPPMLNYSAMNPPPKSRISNKRVAFPINNNSSITKSDISSSSFPPSMPPPIVVSPPTSVLLQQATKENICEFLKSAEAKQHFLNIWEHGKFSDECKRDIESLARALIKLDEESARKIKDRLILQYKDSCGNWLNDINL